MSCLTCGQSVSLCCRGGIRVPVTDEDCIRLGVEARYVTGGSIPKDPVGRCIFLEEDQSCAVYEARPQACRDQDPRVCLSGGLR